MEAETKNRLSTTGKEGAPALSPTEKLKAGADHHAYDRLVKTIRLQFVVIGVLLTFAAIVTPAAWLAFREGGKTEVITLTFDDSIDQFVNLTKGPLNRTEEQQLIVNFLKQYVMWRETIDHVTAAVRDNKIRAFTHPEWFQLVYLRHIDPKKNPQSPRNTYRDAGLTRDIQDVTVSEAPEQAGTYFVRYTAIDRSGPTEVRRKQWLLTILAYRVEGGRSKADAALNPLGLQVLNYTPKELPHES